MKDSQKTTIQEMDEVAKKCANDKLIDAAEIVRGAISEYRKKLEALEKGVENGPIMLEGNTTTGYHCQMMVDPKDIAPILLDYSYPVWFILGEDAPDGMWDDLARKFGLEAVEGFDFL